MNRLLFTLLTLILIMGLLMTGCSSPPVTGGSTQAPEADKLAPDFQLSNLKGQSVALSDFRGRPVLINFWASWCGPCRAEMPYIQQVFEEWSDRGLVILSIDIGESLSTVEGFMQSYNLSFPVLLDVNKTVALKYNVRYIPTSFLVDEGGIIKAVKIGAFSSTAEIERELSKIIP
ncbi:TlpA family protein disulfide reductase [Chloroflexota bacterium]